MLGRSLTIEFVIAATFPDLMEQTVTRSNPNTFKCSNILDASSCVAPTGSTGQVCEVLAPEFKFALVQGGRDPGA